DLEAIGVEGLDGRGRGRAAGHGGAGRWGLARYARGGVGFGPSTGLGDRLSWRGLAAAASDLAAVADDLAAVANGLTLLVCQVERIQGLAKGLRGLANILLFSRAGDAAVRRAK